MKFSQSTVLMIAVGSSIATGSGHPGYLGHLGHFFYGSSGSDPLYKISGSDPDFALDHVHY